MKTAFTASIGTLVGINFLLTGCQPAPKNTSTSNPPQNATSANNISSNASGEVDTITENRSSRPIGKESINNINNNEDITKRLDIAYARNASYKKDECPKLVEFESIDQVVTRKGEQLPSDACEYFVFLNKGDVLSIQSSKDMQANLISPIWFDFANGSYTAEKFDKYTIRLSYNGIRYNPTNFRYDVSLIKSGIKPS